MGTTFRLLAVCFFGLILPQGLGWLGFRATRHKRTLVKLLALLIAPVAFFISAFIFWELSAREIRESGNYVCGAFGAAAVFSTLGGMLLSLVLGVFVFLVTNHIWKKKAAQV